MKKRRIQIAKKYYGENEDIYSDAMKLVDFLNEEEENEIVKVTKQQLMQYKLVAKLSDKERRMAIATEQKEAGVLQREGVKRAD